MKKILSTAVLALAVTPLTALPASANYGTQLCVQDTDGLWFAYVVETEDDMKAIEGLRTEPFPQNAYGCSSYGPVKQTPTLPAEPEPCVPTVIETSSVQTVNNRQLVRKIKRQQRTIKRLRAKLAAAQR